MPITVTANTKTTTSATANHHLEPIITLPSLQSKPSSKSNMTETVLSRKANQKLRHSPNQVIRSQPPAPTPSATMSRIQSFGRSCLNSFARNKEPLSSSTSTTLKKRQQQPQQPQSIGKANQQPVRYRKASGILFGRPPSKPPSSSCHQLTGAKKSQDQQSSPRRSLSRRRPISQFIYIPKQQPPASASTLSPHSKIPRPHSTFVDSPPLIFTDDVGTTHAPLSSSSSSTLSSSTLSSTNTSSSSIKTPVCHYSDPDHQQITALDFLLDDHLHGRQDYFGKKKKQRMSATGRNRLASFETPLLLPSRGLFGLMDKEQKAIQAWRTQQQQEESQQPAPLLREIDDRTELKWQALQKFIVHEIYSTEKSYHDLLVLVRTRYMTPLLAASKEKDPLVKFNDIPILFNHLPALIDLSQKILAGFTMQHPFATVASSLGHQWLQLHEQWTVFLRYAVHYEANNKTIKRACNNVLLLKIEQESLARRETKRLGMADYLIAPIQRVPRYCLLLQDLLRHTPTTDVDYAHLQKVVHTLTGLAKAMNDTQKLRRRKTISS